MPSSASFRLRWRIATSPSNCDLTTPIRFDSGGIHYLKLGKFDDAIVDYNAALKINPKIATSLYGRGIAEFKKSDTTDGNADIAAAKAIRSDIADYMTGLGAPT